MNNKEILQNNVLPIYDVEEVSMLDAMILLKRQVNSTGETSISRAAERLKPASEPHAHQQLGAMSGG
ncbi:MAG: hypothetical protein ABW170_03810 [Candidatus Thiodiazotropha sp. L084R]